MLRVPAIVFFCILTHYLWAICWPVDHRGLPRGRLCLPLHCEEAGDAGLLGGGVPEAAGVTLSGPGTGQIPETADLRNFKKVGTGEKWALVCQAGKVAVFKVGSESQTIRTAGLYVPVEADSMRGDKEILDACMGYDKVHLCRSVVCAEEGQHFKEYALAKDLDGEKFQSKNAELGAAQAGRTLWAWMRSSTGPPSDVWSSALVEGDHACCASRVKWHQADQDVRLGKGVCSEKGATLTPILFEDRFSKTDGTYLCP